MSTITLNPDDLAATRSNLGLGTASTLNVGTSANNIVQLSGSGALPAVSGAALLNLPASGGTVDLVADGSITAGKPVAITEAGKVKQISATGFATTEVIGSTVASSGRNLEYAHLVYDEGNNEVITAIDGGGTTYFARVTLDSSMNTAYTGELAYSHGATYLTAGVGMVYNPAVDRIFVGPYRFSSTSGCYLLRNNSGTLSGAASETFGGSTAAYGTVDVCRSTGVMFVAYQNGSTSNNSAAMGFVDTSVDEQVRWGHEEPLGAMNYGQSYSYYGALRWIPETGLVFMRNIYDQGTEFIYLPSSQWNKDMTDVQSASNSGGTRPRFGRHPNATGDPALNHTMNSGSGQSDYPHGSVWHPWAKRLLMGGRSKAGTDGRISTVSFQNGVASHSYGISFTGLPQMYFNTSRLFVPIPNSNAFAIVFADDASSNALKYCIVDIKLGENAGEDDFVISAEREVNSASHDAFGGVWNTERNAMVIMGRTSSVNKYYGVTPQLAVSNARNFIGFASASVSDTQTLTVHLPGAVNENQSGLTMGRRYLVGHDGNLIEQNNHTATSQGMPFVGTAVAATKIAVGV